MKDEIKLIRHRQQWDYHISNNVIGIIDDEIIFSYCLQESMYENHLINVYITEKYRGKKISYILMENVISDIKKLGFNEVNLKVKKSNEVAIRIYEKYGFTFSNEDTDIRYNWMILETKN